MKKDPSPSERVAIALLGLDKASVSKILSHMSDVEVREITRALTTISNIDRESQLSINIELRKLLKGSEKLVINGKRLAEELTTARFPNSRLSDDSHAGELTSSTLGPLLDTIQLDTLKEIVTKEHPQTQVLFIAHMAPTHSVQLLSTLPEQDQLDLLLRLVNLKSVSKSVIEEVKAVLLDQIGTLDNETEQIDGLQAASTLLSNIPNRVSESLLQQIELQNPTLAEQLKALQFRIEHLANYSKQDLQLILREVPSDLLLIAVKTVTPEYRKFLFGHLSTRAAERLDLDFQDLGPVKRSEVDRAQGRILELVRALEAAGKVQAQADQANEEYV